MLKIKAVLFDLGNTLVYQEPYEPFQKILQENNVSRSTEAIREAFQKGAKDFEAEKYKMLPAREFYTRWNMAILKHLQINRSRRRLATEIDRQWFNFSREYVFVYPEVREVLSRLKRMGLKLGVVTGGYELDIEQILPRAGLQEFFQVCVGTDTTGKRKPHPESFKHALKQLGVDSHEAIFVGDSYQADYLGAENAGMIPVLICREGSTASNVRVIKRLDEIFGILDEISL